MTTLATYLRDTRRARNETSGEAARHAGIPVGYWEEFERGEYAAITCAMLIDIAVWSRRPILELYRMLPQGKAT